MLIFDFETALDQAALPRRKRRCFIDPVKVIPPSEFKQQLLDTSDIVQKKMESTPPTKKAMYYLAYGGVGKFFAYPGTSKKKSLINTSGCNFKI